MPLRDRRWRPQMFFTEYRWNAGRAEQVDRDKRRLIHLDRDYIYIPLNFMASFFGLNMTEFGSGTGRLWTFVITALIFAGITVIRFATQVVDWIQRRPTMQESPWAVTFRMVYYSPLQGFWLASF